MVDIHVQIYKRGDWNGMNVSLGGLLYLTSSARTFSGLFDFNSDAWKIQAISGFDHYGCSLVDDYHIYVRDDDTRVTDLLRFL